MTRLRVGEFESMSIEVTADAYYQRTGDGDRLLLDVGLELGDLGQGGVGREISDGAAKVFARST